jgi:elongation factor 1-gamma
MAAQPTKKSLKLHATKENSRAKKCLVVAKYVNVEVDFAVFTMGETNKTPDFLRMNPNGKVPVLEVPGEGYIWESNAICRYIAGLDESKGLLGTTPLTRAQVNQWIDWLQSEVEPAAFAWLGPILGYIPYNADMHKQGVEQLKKAFAALNLHLEYRTYLVNERLTVADICAAATFLPLYQRVLDPSFRNKYNNVNRWFETISQKDNFNAVLPSNPMAWCTISQKAAGPKAAPKAKKEEEQDETEEAAPEVKEAAKPEPKKEAKKDDKKKKKDDDDDEEEEEAPQEEKKKNPLDELPKSAFILDDFKRTFSNNPVDVTLEYMDKNFDAAGWSLWYCTYKFNSELTKVFMSANLIGGFFQRMDRMRKYSFGVVSIYGEDGNGKHDISGFWIVRGQEIPQFMRDECDDVDLYNWNKIQWSDFQAEKPKIRAYLTGEPVEGKPYADGKTFK